MSSIIDKLFGPSDAERAAEAERVARIERVLASLAVLPQFVGLRAGDAPGGSGRLLNVVTGCVASRDGAMLCLSWCEPPVDPDAGGGRVARLSGDEALSKYVRAMQLQAAGLEAGPSRDGSSG